MRGASVRNFWERVVEKNEKSFDDGMRRLHGYGLHGAGFAG